jgi:hypothetical protein
MDWIYLTLDQDQCRVLVNLPVQQNAGTFFSGYTTGCLSKWAQLYGVG